jgi:Icc-related predicted phosphoesterase
MGGYRTKAILHGHIHESHGVATWNGIIVSNAATTQQVIELGDA